jgi:hypothetical protein
MNSREKVFAVLEGKAIEEKPVFIWPQEEMYSDFAVMPATNGITHVGRSRVVLAEIESPFSRSTKRGMQLVQVLRTDPQHGETLLNSLISETKAEIETAIERNADGIFYWLRGAEPSFTTPMEYGGHFLEADREILQSANAALIVLFVDGGAGTYLDFVSDLPASIFAWDCEQTGVDVNAVRRMRNGVLATNSAAADILFGHNYGVLRPWIKRSVATSSV